MTPKVGERVGAWLSADAKEVRLLGYGVYAGDGFPSFLEGPIAEDLKARGYKIPKIVLDSGLVVWGCQCWWGDEERMKALIGDRAVVLVGVDS